MDSGVHVSRTMGRDARGVGRLTLLMNMQQSLR